MSRDELAAWLRLLLTPGVGPEHARRLLSAFGLPEAVFEQSIDALSAVVSGRIAQSLQTPPDDLEPQLERLMAWLASSPDRHVLTLADPRFPSDLLQMADPPLLLYVQGHPEALCHPRRLAIVVSRNPTPQGETNARQFAFALGQAGVCVVSGLALGVDGAAHTGALDAGAPTVAVAGPLPDAQPHHRRAVARHAGGGSGGAVGLPDHRTAGGRAGARGVRHPRVHPRTAVARLPCADPAGRQAGGVGAGHSGRSAHGRSTGDHGARHPDATRQPARCHGVRPGELRRLAGPHRTGHRHLAGPFAGTGTGWLGGAAAGWLVAATRPRLSNSGIAQHRHRSEVSQSRMRWNRLCRATRIAP